MARRVVGIEFKQRRIKRLEKQLSKFGPVIFAKVVTSAVNSAMKPVLDLARILVPEDTGLLGKSLGRKTKKYPGRFVAMSIVGPRKGFHNPETGQDPHNYAHLVEFGVAPHTIGKGSIRVARSKKQTASQTGGGHPGFPARPFMRPALERNKRRVVKLYIKKLTAGIKRRVKKAQKG